MRAAAALLVVAGCAEGHRWDVAAGDAAVTPSNDAANAPDADVPDAAPPVDASLDAAPTYPPVDWAPVDGDLGGLAAYLHVPAGIPVGSQPPLVVVLHGCWEDA